MGFGQALLAPSAGSRRDSRISRSKAALRCATTKLIEQLENRWLLSNTDPLYVDALAQPLAPVSVESTTVTRFSADFESGDGGMTTVDTPSLENLWHPSTYRSASPDHAWYYGEESDHNYDNGAHNAGALLSPLIDLTDASEAQLDFNYLLKSEDETAYDIARVQITTNAGASWSTLAEKGSLNPLINSASGVTTFNSWSGSLASYVGHEVQLRFTFDTVDNINNLFEGWFIDDIVVSATITDPVPTVVSVSPASGSILGTGSFNVNVTFSEAVSGVDATDLVLSGSAYIDGTTTVGTPVMVSSTEYQFPIADAGGGTLNLTLAPDAGDIVDSADQSLVPYSWSYTLIAGDRLEPNDSLAAATDLGVISGTHNEDNLTIHAAGDEDWFRFGVGATGQVTVHIAFLNSQGNLDLMLYDANGTEIGSSAGQFNSETIQATLPKSWYYAQVFGFNSSALSPDYDLSITAPAIVPPTVTAITPTPPTLTSADTLTYTVSFSDEVTGVDVSDFAVVTTGTATATVQTATQVVGNPAAYTVTLDCAGDGMVRLDLVDDDTIRDAVDTPLGGPGSGNGNFTGGVFTIDHTPPTVTGFFVNYGLAGGNQRSMVKNLVLVYSEPVNLATGALELQRRSGATVADVTLDVATSDRVTYTITFSGPAIIGGSLPDGMYKLVSVAANITDDSGLALLQNDVRYFHRLFGDSDGDRDVDNADLLRFKAAFNRSANYSTYWYFDFMNDGNINASDYLELKSRLVKRLLA